MLFTWDTTNLCIVFRQWHIRGTASLVFSLLAIIAICAGYEALREGIRRYESFEAAKQDAAPRESNPYSILTLPLPNSALHTPIAPSIVPATYLVSNWCMPCRVRDVVRRTLLHT